MPAKESSPQRSQSLWTPLCNAVKEGNYESVKEILQQQTFPTQSSPGETILSESPLHLAIVDEKEDLVDLLLSHGIDLACTNLYGETPLHIACRTGNTGLVQKLLNAGAILEYKDCEECTPLFHAIYSNKPEVAKLLIQAGADLDSLNEELMSPLDHAVLYNRNELITLLIKGGCALDKTTGQVYYPGHYSNSILFSLWSNGDIESVQVMINAGYRVTSSHLMRLFQVAQQLNWDDSLLRCVHNMIREPMTLKCSSRVSIRRVLMNLKCYKNQSVQAMITELPLPDILKSYVAMM